MKYGFSARHSSDFRHGRQQETHVLSFVATCSFLVCVAVVLAGFVVLGGPINAKSFKSDRMLEITNSCDFDVRVGVNGARMLLNGSSGACGANGACPNGGTCKDSNQMCYGGGISCDASTPCASGGRCFTPSGASAGLCYFDIPELSGVLLGKSKSKTVTLSNAPVTQTLSSAKTQTLKWSGNIYGGTNCSETGTGTNKQMTCETAVCGPFTDQAGVACYSGQGPGGPVTLAEFTFVPDGVDTYDISLINGVNVPMSMEPNGTIPSKIGNDYWCGAPGGVGGSKVLKGCSWAFETKANEEGSTETGQVDYGKYLRMVTATTKNPKKACPTGQVEGSAWNAPTATIELACGTQIGWWTADEYCTVPVRPEGNPFNCTKTAKLPSKKTATYQELYGCNGNAKSSCYQKGATTDCCGAPSWHNIFKSDKNSGLGDFYATNSTWSTVAKPWAEFVKLACPTAYSFPFDDITSTFQCNSTTKASAENTMGYKITFCPGGKSGF